MNDLYGMPDGSILQTHDEQACAGEACCIHRPSDHPLNTAPLVWDGFRRVMHRICPCGIPHPDPDHVFHMAQHSIMIAAVHSMHDCCPLNCCGQRTDHDQ